MATLTLTQNTRTALTLRNNGNIIISGGLIVENPVGWVGTRRAATVSMSSTLSGTSSGSILTIRARVRANTLITNLTLANLFLQFTPGDAVINPYIGQMKPEHFTAFTRRIAEPDSHFHPSYQGITAATWVATDNIGYGIFLSSHLDRPKMNALWGNSEQNDRLPQLKIHTTQTLQAGASADFVLEITIADNAPTPFTFQTLLQNYRTAFRAWAGPLKYTRTEKPIVQFTYFDSSRITSGNPLGIDDGGNQIGGRRFDTPQSVTGATSWPVAVCPSLQQVSGRGSIMWGFGHDVRGMYRTDHHVIFGSVAPQIPGLMSAFSSYGLTVGTMARPTKALADTSAYVNNNTDTQTALELDPDDVNHMAHVMARFTASHAAGFRSYYLDETGIRGRDLKWVQAIRALVGADVPMYAEFHFDLMMPFCGRYVEVTKTGSVFTYSFMPASAFEVLNWIYPEATYLGVRRGTTSYADLLDRGMAPLLHDFNLPSQVTEINNWRNANPGDWLPD